MTIAENWPRQRIVTALTPALLEIKVAGLEAQGWRRIGEVAAAVSVVEGQVAYWSQDMSLPRPLQPSAG